MRDQPFDKSSKWLIEHQARGILRLGGLRGVRQYRAGPGQIVQPSKFPDGLLEVTLEGRSKPLPVLIEVATFPEKRAEKQALDDLTLASHALGRLPELLMLILRPKGRHRITGLYAIQSELGWSELGGKWKPVELWTLSAEEYLSEADVGGVPWVPLMQFAGPPEALLERCREKIEREAHPKDQPTLKAVAQVLARLKFADPELWSLLGGKAVMIESPLIQELRADLLHDAILDVLKDRFSVPRDIRKLLRAILDEKKLRKLTVLAGKCRDLDEFREALLS